MPLVLFQPNRREESGSRGYGLETPSSLVFIKSIVNMLQRRIMTTKGKRHAETLVLHQWGGKCRLTAYRARGTNRFCLINHQ